ncbi:hypothetical protein [Streptomyces drozdowiczii]|uniref:hypothetical protein n=1 Tax=Streptomyces drozdowiczii TaxID=202862 RepID=UPI0031E84CC1
MTARAHHNRRANDTSRGARPAPRMPTGTEHAPPPVVVHPVHDGVRRVAIRGRPVGTASSPGDVMASLRQAGVVLDAEELPTTLLVEWRGGGPDRWQE